MIRIKEIRKAKGITAKQLAEHCQVAESTMSLYENGKREPDYHTLLTIANYLGVTTDYLLTGKETDPTAEAEEADELSELLQELKTRPEMRMLFSLAKGATKEDVELAVAIIERMRRDGSNGE